MNTPQQRRRPEEPARVDDGIGADWLVSPRWPQSLDDLVAHLGPAFGVSTEPETPEEGRAFAAALMRAPIAGGMPPAMYQEMFRRGWVARATPEQATAPRDTEGDYGAGDSSARH